MAIVITKQPSNFTAVAGDTVIFSVEATGVTEYQWQVQSESDYWNDLTWAGNKSATMSHELNVNNIQYRYRCKLTGADGEVVYTNIVKLVNIVITKQPVSVAANVNDTISIILEATGDGLTYDWQYSTDGTKFYALSASASASKWTYDQPTLTFKGYIGYLKYYFRCKITDSNGDSVFSNIVRAINLAEAGAGFILPETMHSLAEVIRAKTETTDKILPADMAALVEGLGGGCTILSGTFTPSSKSKSATLGTTLPDSDNYLFACVCAGTLSYESSAPRPITACATANVEGTASGFLRLAPTSSGGYDAYVSSGVTVSGNKVSHGTYGFAAKEYRWWYCYG